MRLALPPSTTSLQSRTAPRPMQSCTTRRSVVSPILTSVRHRVRRRPGPRGIWSDSDRIVGRSSVRSPDSEVRFNITSASGLRSDLEPRLFTGQQSNTSVMLGNTAIIKLFRRLELGHNLDIEVHRALNAADISDVARLFGWVEGSWVSGGRQLDADLAMVIEQLAGAVDGWDLALDSLKAEDASPVRDGSGFASEARRSVRRFRRSTTPCAPLFRPRRCRARARQ